MHVLCDGCERRKEAELYLVTPSEEGLKSSLVLAKCRFAPIKKISIPKLELAGAKLAVTLLMIAQKELTIPLDDVLLWTDSETVLKYIRNETKRFQRFVSNRVAYIRKRTEVDQWHHVPGDLNPADVASRGMNIHDFIRCKEWKFGPEFLRLDKSTWPIHGVIPDLNDQDPEVKKPIVISAETKLDPDASIQLIESMSDFRRLVWTVCGLIKIQQKCRGLVPNKSTLEEHNEAELSLVRFEQSRIFDDDLEVVQTSGRLPKKSPIRKLSPFLDSDGLLRAGGRLSQALDVDYNARHPVILPNSHMAVLIIREIHAHIGHLGQQFVITLLREKYRIIGEGSIVKKILRNCIRCKRYQSKVEQQVMADLPTGRLARNHPPFVETGVDLFRPFKIIRGRTSVDRYGLIFTCLTSRAAHLEVVFDKSTDSFLQALRRFIARRGQVRRMRSDNGTNFVGADRELGRMLEELNQSEISEELAIKGIEWSFNPPYSHHFGGIWERGIRTIRKVMAGLMSETQRNLNDEGLSTLMCKVESILNGRSLTPVSNDPNDLEALTPNHLLLQQAGPTYPPGLFCLSDQYMKQRWRQIQYMADMFWKRLTKEYSSQQMSRNKWIEPKRDVQVGDLVLMVVEGNPRNQWPLGRVLEVFPSSEWHVRSVQVKTAKSEYRRPIS
ncbi:uncharacterized protein LOC131891683 [Tigriopus californicus]|uniref:uncharacterized protein LOC131891683 n=1 Tax=Tigriopus californicus TaxID=6832 RepID=UPI0027DA9484|nr:uncharacterized protein LOC131891683 [Tigriopus californicus]